MSRRRREEGKDTEGGGNDAGGNEGNTTATTKRNDETAGGSTRWQLVRPVDDASSRSTRRRLGARPTNGPNARWWRG